MSLTSRRTEKGWSQEDLAQVSGVSVRTIQRAESGNKIGLESLKCLAAVLETSVSTLIEEQQPMPVQTMPETPRTDREQEVIEQVEALKWFYVHLGCFLIFNVGMLGFNLLTTPDEIWVIYMTLPWIFGLAVHAWSVFGDGFVFGREWEQREFEKRMRQK
jgi:transcriptional regulator with XRE-family HTH domain